MSEPDFVRICTLAELPAQGAAVAEVDGVRVCVARDAAGQVHAIDDRCSHGAVSLAEGDVEDCTIECWLHGSRFDLRTGEPLGLPATQPVAVYPVKIDGDDVYVAVPDAD